MMQNTAVQQRRYQSHSTVVKKTFLRFFKFFSRLFAFDVFKNKYKNYQFTTLFKDDACKLAQLKQ